MKRLSRWGITSVLVTLLGSMFLAVPATGCWQCEDKWMCEEAVACPLRPLETCEEHGCTRSMACKDLCPRFRSAAACDAAEGCLWYSGDFCTYDGRACYGLSEEDCGTHPYCVWEPACTGETDCDFDESECAKHADCKWEKRECQ